MRSKIHEYTSYRKGMSKSFISLYLFLSCSAAFAQMQSLDTIKAPTDYDNIYFRPIFADSLVSTFVILVKKQVKEHKHVNHTEHVFILEGEGEMTLGDKKFTVKKGDIIPIPKNTFHSLKTTSATPVKVYSVQAPNFDGKDRVYKE